MYKTFYLLLISCVIIELRLHICREITNPSQVLSTVLDSSIFRLPSEAFQNRKAILVSFSIINSILFFPPYFRLYQLRADFNIICPPSVSNVLSSSPSLNRAIDLFLDKVAVYNSSSYFVSSKSLLSITEWGGRPVNLTTPSKSTSDTFFSYAQLLYPGKNEQYDRSTCDFNNSIINDPSGLQQQILPFKTACGIVLYSLQLVNFVVGTKVLQI